MLSQNEEERWNGSAMAKALELEQAKVFRLQRTLSKAPAPTRLKLEAYRRWFDQRAVALEETR